MANEPSLWKQATRKQQLVIRAKPKQTASPRSCSSRPVITRDSARTAISASRPFADSQLGLASRPAFARQEDRLLNSTVGGHELTPGRTKQNLVQVFPKTESSRLFRYACLHWSIPISDGYGRRLRFLIFDEGNNRLMGLFALGDP